jgi:uncharacterized protein
VSTSTVRLNLRVAPGAKRTAIVGPHGNGWKVSVAAPPERGRANDELVSLLARELDLARRDVRVVAGLGGRDKVVELGGITVEEAERRLRSAGKRRS